MIKFVKISKKKKAFIGLKTISSNENFTINDWIEFFFAIREVDFWLFFINVFLLDATRKKISLWII